MRSFALFSLVSAAFNKIGRIKLLYEVAAVTDLRIDLQVPRFWSPAQLIMKTHYQLKFAKLCRGITSQFTLKRAKTETFKTRALVTAAQWPLIQ